MITEASERAPLFTFYLILYPLEVIFSASLYPITFSKISKIRKIKNENVL